MKDINTDISVLGQVSRRTLLRRTGQVALSVSAVTLLAGCDAMASNTKRAEPSRDVGILNVALGLEHEAIGAYQIGAESGLLQKEVLEVAVVFQDHHKAHRDALVATVRKLGGTPVEEKSIDEYASALDVASLENQTDVLMLAARLEKGAANAYIGVIPAFGDGDLSQIAGRLAADETMHWSLLASALGQPVPKQALTFGA